MPSTDLVSSITNCYRLIVSLLTKYTASSSRNAQLSQLDLVIHRYRLPITQRLRGLKKGRKRNSYRFLHLVYPVFHYQLNVITTTLECWRKQLPICGFGTKLKCSSRSRFTAIRKEARPISFHIRRQAGSTLRKLYFIHRSSLQGHFSVIMN